MVLLLGPGLAAGCQQNEIDKVPRAVIIDQLSLEHPNAAFVKEVSNLLETMGLVVDVFSGNDVDVDLYRRLPRLGYPP